MSRCDQYVGLTKTGRRFLSKVKSASKAIIETCKICYQAWNPDPLQGDRIIIGDRMYQEELQLAPWSSGPVYLTHIAIYNNKTGNLIGYVGSWELDSSVKNEIDEKNETYYI